MLQVGARAWTKFLQIRLILFADGETWGFVLDRGLIGFIGASSRDSFISWAWESLPDDNSISAYSTLINVISTGSWCRFFVVQDAPLYAEDRLIWNRTLSQCL